MRDCENIEIRETLPELVHDRLGADARARALAHLASCGDCTEELALLRAARRAVESTAPRIDAAAIARAVATRRAQDVRPVRRWNTTAWRAAAAVVVMALGAAGVLAVREDGGRATVPVSDSVAALALPQPSADTQLAMAPSPAESARAPRAEAARPSAAALGVSFGDLTDAELAAVIDAIEGGADVGPAAEPAPTPMIVTSGSMQ